MVCLSITKLVSVEHRGIKIDQIFKFVVMHIPYGEKHWQGYTGEFSERP